MSNQNSNQDEEAPRLTFLVDDRSLAVQCDCGGTREIERVHVGWRCPTCRRIYTAETVADACSTAIKLLEDRRRALDQEGGNDQESEP